MAKIIQIGYGSSILVPSHCLAQFVELLEECHQLEGSNQTGTLKAVEYTVSNPHPDLGREMTQREQELEKTASDNNSRWYKEYTKANELEKQVACLKSQVNDLIERGVSGAVFGGTDRADAIASDDETEI
ncbi:MAG: hypothetical protein KGI54_16790 [Pseudomonadota bacterium]|nr:hypothetical protein [Pseudomonadota bacterium]